MELPEYIKVCPWCGGIGEYEQTYTAGCGLGYYRSVGRCDHCTPNGQGYRSKGIGYLYKHNKEPVPASVVAQIETALHTPKDESAPSGTGQTIGEHHG